MKRCIASARSAVAWLALSALLGSAMPNKERRTELGQIVARQPTEE